MAGKLAHLTGETMMGAIVVTLRERLERERSELSSEARAQDFSHRKALRRHDGRRPVGRRARRLPT